MRFTFAGRDYELTFERRKQPVVYYTKGVSHTIQSTYPFTTVAIFEQTKQGQILVSEATVGCLHTDRYNPEQGRLWALKSLNGKLKRNNWSVEFRRAVWQAYIDRNKKQIIVRDEPLKQLPAATLTSTEVVLPPPTRFIPEPPDAGLGAVEA
jgi:hypothetical protein